MNRVDDLFSILPAYCNSTAFYCFIRRNYIFTRTSDKKQRLIKKIRLDLSSLGHAAICHKYAAQQFKMQHIPASETRTNVSLLDYNSAAAFAPGPGRFCSKKLGCIGKMQVAVRRRLAVTSTLHAEVLIFGR